MSLQTKQIEELFLKLFKVTVLIAMGLCLLAVIGLAINVAYQSSKRPVEPEPAQKAPQKDVSLDDLKKLLEKQAQPKEAGSAGYERTSPEQAMVVVAAQDT